MVIVLLQIAADMQIETMRRRARSLDMRKILILGTSGGVGSALATEYVARGAQIVGLSRRVDGFDITDPKSVAHHLDGIGGQFDQVIVATGALSIGGAEPEKTIKAIQRKAMMDQFALNAVGPALVLSQAHRLLRRDTRSVFAVLSARVGSIEDNRLGGWISYRTAKAALNQVVRTAAIELRRSHRQSICVALHPGTVATEFSEKYLERHQAVSPQEAATNLIEVLDGLAPSQSGEFYDWAGKQVPW